ncbi:hypothetical protein AB25_5202 [Escherichia coli 2-005-03_S1_C2]|nr:hypothetical protein AB25_5202 [Escherichia coli 2-005-03_S1_C2]EZK35018.1 hypothetical protein AA97_5112 [Escherichia coli 2-005-03_S1_C1]KDA60573.1 hypothetical protein AA99_5344 [Escherichia coli 2-052-05_S1_C1]KDT23613.1 hypothetical protein AB55_4975 [Escherichia coli 2-052-05_S1_C3]KDW30238.1 hypothetical protein AB61_5357 [Escherichia coli 2-177-06_S1_C3]KDW39077.1 hypothetical protein AB29_5377 [Escherichia coli 2-177-06_S1_C2]
MYEYPGIINSSVRKCIDKKQNKSVARKMNLLIQYPFIR